MNRQFNIICGDALTELRSMASESVNCCVTSPPYFGLRDYGTAEWSGGDSECTHAVRKDPKTASSTLGGGKGTTGHQQEGFRGQCPRCGAVRIDEQIGLESSPDAFIARLVDVFREVRRVLKDDGTLWVNIAGSYAGSGKGENPEGSEWSGFVGNKAREDSAKVNKIGVTGGDEPFALRNDLTPDEMVYVLSELAAHFRERNEVAEPNLAVGIDPAIASLASGE